MSAFPWSASGGVAAASDGRDVVVVAGRVIRRVEHTIPVPAPVVNSA